MQKTAHDAKELNISWKKNVEIKINGGIWLICTVKHSLPEIKNSLPTHQCEQPPGKSHHKQDSEESFLAPLWLCQHNPWGTIMVINPLLGKGGQLLVGRSRSYLRLSKRSMNSYAGVRAFQESLFVSLLGSAIKTWPQDQEDAKGKWLGQGFAHCSTEQLMMQFVFWTQKGSKARREAQFCLRAKPCWALISSTICSPTLRTSGRK